MSEIKGIYTKEVWDWKLSTVKPTLYNSGQEFWRIALRDNTTGKVVREHTTDIPCEKGDAYDYSKVAKCFEWLKSVRDEYARPDIEELKPKVAFARLVEADLHEKLRGKNKRDGKVITVTYFADLEQLMEAG